MKNRDEVEKQIKKLRKKLKGRRQHASDLARLIGGFEGLTSANHVKREIRDVEERIKALKWVLK